MPTNEPDAAPVGEPCERLARVLFTIMAACTRTGLSGADPDGDVGEIIAAHIDGLKSRLRALEAERTAPTCDDDVAAEWRERVAKVLSRAYGACVDDWTAYLQEADAVLALLAPEIAARDTKIADRARHLRSDAHVMQDAGAALDALGVPHANEAGHPHTLAVRIGMVAAERDRIKKILLGNDKMFVKEMQRADVATARAERAEAALRQARLALVFADDCMGECGDKHSEGRATVRREIAKITTALSPESPASPAEEFASRVRRCRRGPDGTYVVLPEPNPAEGWVLVPREPTDEMLEEAVKGTRAEVSYADAEEVYRAMLEAAPAPPDASSPASPWRPTHQHVKRGTTYRVLGEAEVQISDAMRIPGWSIDGDLARIVEEGDRLTVYQAKDGKLWCRFPDEFNDGRFEPLPAPPAPTGGRDA